MHKLIIIVLVILLGAALLLLGTPGPAEELLEKYTLGEIVVGVLGVSAVMALPLSIPFVLFPRVFE